MQKNEYLKMYKLEDSHFWFLGKRYFVDSVLSKYKSGIRKILDIGSGTGGMTKHLEKYGEVLGIEKDKTGIELSKKRNINVIKGSAENLNLNKKSFDLVTIFDVLYHRGIKSEDSVLRGAYKALSKNGLLLVTDSANKSLRSSHDEVTQGKTRYSLSEMENMIKRNGFKILKSTYVYFSLFPAIYFKRKLFDKITQNRKSDVEKVPRLVNIILLNILIFESFLLNYISFPFGTSVLVLAKKN